jgi:ATP-dependent Clp protease ATP-binding subunit ClpC
MSDYNFTGGVRQALVMARQEAMALHHEYVAPEHLLLGVLRVPGELGHQVLSALGVSFEGASTDLLAMVAPGDKASLVGPDLPYTSRARRCLDLAMIEAKTLGDQHVGTEHLLLGLMLEGKNMACQLLEAAGVSAEKARAEVQRLRSEEGPPQRTSNS